MEKHLKRNYKRKKYVHSDHLRINLMISVTLSD